MKNSRFHPLPDYHSGCRRAGLARSAMTKRLRIARCLTQEGFAKLLGVHRVTVSAWETGHYLMPVRRFYATLALLGEPRP